MRVQVWKTDTTAPPALLWWEPLRVGLVHHTHPYHNPFQPASQCVTRAILSLLLYLISTHQRPGSSLLALSLSHQGYAALMLRRQLSLSPCIFLLTAPLSTPLLQPAAPHRTPSHRAPDLQDPQLPQLSCPQPRQHSVCIWNMKAAKPPPPRGAGSDHEPHPASSLTSTLRLEGENAQHPPPAPPSGNLTSSLPFPAPPP